MGDFMFGKRCTLCGGKLVNNKCTLCGLDNSKSDENYKLNIGSCDNQPLTHVHGEKRPEKNKNAVQKSKQAPKKISTAKAGGKKNRKKAGGLIASILIILIFLGSRVPEFAMDIRYKLMNLLEETSDFFGADDYDEYEAVSRELSETGDIYEITLDPGNYIVGVHIPEGTYRAELVGEYGSFLLDDAENNIYFWGNLGKYDTDNSVYMEDVRCYTGAQLEVDSEGALKFYSENAQTADMFNLPNPLTEAVMVRDGDIAGIDFSAGTYDIVMSEGETHFAYIVPGTVWEDPEEDYVDDYVETTDQVWISTYNGEFVYRNLYLPENTEILIDEGEVLLIPSEVIPESYEGYYYIYDNEETYE